MTAINWKKGLRKLFAIPSLFFQKKTKKEPENGVIIVGFAGSDHRVALMFDKWEGNRRLLGPKDGPGSPKCDSSGPDHT